VKDKLRKLEQPIAEKRRKAQAAFRQSLVQDLMSVKSAAELSELANKAEQSIARNPAYEFPAEKDPINDLIPQLYKLAGHWGAGTLPPSENPSRGPVSALIWAASIESVRQRIYQEVLARREGFRELGQDEFRALPLRDALAKLSANAGSGGNWKRAMEILEILKSLEPETQNGYIAHNAISSYLRGLQQEGAGDIEMAVESYRVVVATLSDGIPLKEASARLADLRKKKPEAFKPQQARFPQR
jgi:hypothetical protein